MNWRPISEADLLAQMRRAVSKLDVADGEKFAAFQTSPHRIFCKRSGQKANEEIFVVAQTGSKVLVFDDVEDEFGVGELADSSVLEKWDLIGSLSEALTRF